MKKKQIFKQYVQEKYNKEVKEFVRIRRGRYAPDNIVTKDSNGNIEESLLDYEDMLFWVIGSFKIKSK